jgi:glucose-6-phosphate 1-dehydrogenase
MTVLIRTFREWEFHPITADLFVEYKCNLDCWRCWAYNNKVKGMTEDVARRSIDRLYDHGAAALESGGIRQLDHEQWENFEKRLFYLVPDPSDAECYRQLRAKLEEMHQAGSSTNHLFYVSTLATVAVPIIESLGSADLKRNHQGWSRIVLDKRSAAI